MIHIGLIQSKMQLGVDLQRPVNRSEQRSRLTVGHGRLVGVVAWSSRRPAGQMRAAERRLELLQGVQDPIGRQRSLLNHWLAAA